MMEAAAMSSDARSLVGGVVTSGRNWGLPAKTMASNQPKTTAVSCDASTGFTSLNINGFCQGANPCQRCENVDMHSYMSLAAAGLSQTNDLFNDIWGYSNGADDYVIVGSKANASVVLVSDPNTPTFIGNLALNGAWYTDSNIGDNVWADIKVDGNNVYVVSWRHGSTVQIIDGSSFANHTPGNDFSSTGYTPAGFTGSHNIMVWNGNLYMFWNSPAGGFYACSSSNTGIIIADAATGASKGCVSDSIVNVGNDMACHDYSGTEICFVARGGSLASNENMSGYGTVAINVSNISATNPASLAFTVPNYTNMHFTHQPALTATGSWMIVTDEADEWDYSVPSGTTCRLFVYSVTSSSATLSNTFDTLKTVSEHQGYFHDDFYFLAMYKKGFFGYSIDQATGVMTYEGNMDTWAFQNGRGWAGAWSVFVFPYTACGGNTYYTVAVSDNSGLYLMQPQWKTGICSC
jgi:choice-of-anchor B domain-containing protein